MIRVDVDFNARDRHGHVVARVSDSRLRGLRPGQEVYLYDPIDQLRGQAKVASLDANTMSATFDVDWDSFVDVHTDDEQRQVVVSAPSVRVHYRSGGRRRVRLASVLALTFAFIAILAIEFTRFGRSDDTSAIVGAIASLTSVLVTSWSSIARRIFTESLYHLREPSYIQLEEDVVTNEVVGQNDRR